MTLDFIKGNFSFSSISDFSQLTQSWKILLGWEISGTHGPGVAAHMAGGVFHALEGFLVIHTVQHEALPREEEMCSL